MLPPLALYENRLSFVLLRLWEDLGAKLDFLARVRVLPITQISR